MADKRKARIALILGEDEEASSSITIKDLMTGKEASGNISNNEEWRSGKVSQRTIPKETLVDEIKKMFPQKLSEAEPSKINILIHII